MNLWERHWRRSSSDHRLYSIDDFVREHHQKHMFNGAATSVMHHIQAALSDWSETVRGSAIATRKFTYDAWKSLLFQWRQTSDYYQFNANEPYDYSTGGINQNQPQPQNESTIRMNQEQQQQHNESTVRMNQDQQQQQNERTLGMNQDQQQQRNERAVMMNQDQQQQQNERTLGMNQDQQQQQSDNTVGMNQNQQQQNASVMNKQQKRTSTNYDRVISGMNKNRTSRKGCGGRRIYDDVSNKRWVRSATDFRLSSFFTKK